jgi:hypothetical protein
VESLEIHVLAPSKVLLLFNWDVQNKSAERCGAALVREMLMYCQCPNTVQFL